MLRFILLGLLSVGVVGCQGIDKTGLFAGYDPWSHKFFITDTTESGTTLEGVELRKLPDGTIEFKLDKAERNQSVIGAIESISARIDKYTAMHEQLGKNTVMIVDSAGRLLSTPGMVSVLGGLGARIGQGYPAISQPASTQPLSTQPIDTAVSSVAKYQGLLKVLGPQIDELLKLAIPDLEKRDRLTQVISSVTDMDAEAVDKWVRWYCSFSGNCGG